VKAWPADGEVLVSVSDTGVGISVEDQGRIFQRFEQGGLVDGRRPNGAGLGLALCKEFVEMHGGRIWVGSEIGTGSTFTFSLPLSQGVPAC
jgi:signal transduction histidine kinase